MKCFSFDNYITWCLKSQIFKGYNHGCDMILKFVINVIIMLQSVLNLIMKKLVGLYHRFLFCFWLLIKRENNDVLNLDDLNRLNAKFNRRNAFLFASSGVTVEEFNTAVYRCFSSNSYRSRYDESTN